MSFDRWNNENVIKAEESQSLWNRAMSFDATGLPTSNGIDGLNPFGTGQCLSTAVGC